MNYSGCSRFHFTRYVRKATEDWPLLPGTKLINLNALNCSVVFMMDKRHAEFMELFFITKYGKFRLQHALTFLGVNGASGTYN